MAVREFWEIKWIQWINVQEDWVTQVSIADTVNIVGWWTVTDVWGVATINIPEWVTWYREDVTAGNASYTFVNSPATATSFLVFTDSGTLMFLWIDYTYDPDTETITFLSLGANEAAYIWVAHAIVQWWWIWDMVKAVYDPTNINSSAFDYNNFINTPTIWDAVLTIQKNWTTIDTFTANATSPKTINVTVPTKVTDLSDASDYVTDAELTSALSPYALSSAIPTKTSDLVNDSWFLTSAWDVDWPASSINWNIVVFDGNSGKVIKDSGLNIQLSNNPTWDLCEVYYDNGTIFLKVHVDDFLLLESWDYILTEDGDKFIMES